MNEAPQYPLAVRLTDEAWTALNLIEPLLKCSRNRWINTVIVNAANDLAKQNAKTDDASVASPAPNPQSSGTTTQRANGIADLNGGE